MKNPQRLEKYQRWMAVFGTTQGQSVLNDLRAICGYEQSSLNRSTADGKIDPFYMAAREGKRAVFIDILDTLKEPPDIPEPKEDEDEDITA